MDAMLMLSRSDGASSCIVDSDGVPSEICWTRTNKPKNLNLMKYYSMDKVDCIQNKFLLLGKFCNMVNFADWVTLDRNLLLGIICECLFPGHSGKVNNKHIQVWVLTQYGNRYECFKPYIYIFST